MTSPVIVPERNPARSNTVFLLAVSLFASAILASTIGLVTTPGIGLGGLGTVQFTAVFYLAAGIIVFLYWLWDRPDYSTSARPLGVILIAIEIGLTGAVLVVAAVILLLLPIIGIIGVAIGAVGAGSLLEAKGLLDGKEWAVIIILLLTVLGIISGAVVLALYGAGAPLVSVYQLWYLRRPQARRFFTG
jgi:hypothetical protein